ncbi:carbohydrate-binding protein [Catellatospora coxensis]
MPRQRSLALAGVLAVVAALAVILPSSSASAANCVAAWQSSSVYTGGMTASHNGRNWLARWWTQNETPGVAEVWSDQGTCTGGTTPPPGGTCSHPNWAAGTWYTTGSIVRYTNGLYYIAEHDNPGYDPTISTWYWDPYTCSGTPRRPRRPARAASSSPRRPSTRCSRAATPSTPTRAWSPR